MMGKEILTLRIEPENWQSIKESARETRLSIGDYISVLQDFAVTGGFLQDPEKHAGQLSFEAIFDIKVRQMRNKRFFERAASQIDRMEGVSPEDRAQMRADLEQRLGKE